VDACLAIDVGGTKLAAGMVTEAGVLLRDRRVQTPASGDAEVLFAALAALIDDVIGRGPPRSSDGAHGDEVIPVACGVGCGGPMDLGAGTVSPLNIPAWRGFPLVTRVAEHTGLTVTMDNDAKALALGEGWTGAARGCADYIAMVVSTGVGGGIVLGGQIVDGASGNAGHIGHVIVEPDGRRCACGGRGCLEAEASGTAIAARTGRPAAEASQEEVVRAGTLVGRAVGSACNLLDIELAVVGGSVALGFGAPFFAAANDELHARARLSFSARARIVPSGLGPAGPLVGAGALAWRHATRAGTRP
jgi:glucokinase